jgi:hypothetical protein
MRVGVSRGIQQAHGSEVGHGHGHGHSGSYLCTQHFQASPRFRATSDGGWRAKSAGKGCCWLFGGSVVRSRRKGMRVARSAGVKRKRGRRRST